MDHSEYVRRISVLDVPVDIVDPQYFPEIIWDLIRVNEFKQIIFLTFRGLMRARRNQEYMECLKKAALIIPISRRVLSGAKFLKRDELFLYSPFPFIIKLLGQLEKMNQNIYILGGSHEMVRISEGTLRSSFPKLQFVGRCSGDIKVQYEKDVLSAIKKASPTLLLAGKGLKGRDLWLFRRRKKLSSGLALWDKDCYYIFSGKKKKRSDKTSAVFFREFFSTLIKPWRIGYVFMFLWYAILLIVHRTKEKNAAKQ